MAISFRFKDKNKPGNSRSSIIVFVSGVIFYFLLNSILLPISSDGFFGFYVKAFREADVLFMIRQNILYYYDILRYVFGQGEGILFRISSITKYVLIYGFLFGMIITWIKRFEFGDLVFILYLAILLIYPYQAGGFRFLIPIIPFFLKYIGVSIKTILEMVRLPKTDLLASIFVSLVFLQNIQGVFQIIQRQNRMEEGPQSPHAQSTLGFIKNDLPEDAVIVFAKPRAISFYTGKKSAALSRRISFVEMHNAFQRTNTHYIMIKANDEEVNDPKLREYVSVYKDELRVLWQNEGFTIYTDNFAKQ
jgi:hypothetical protein